MSAHAIEASLRPMPHRMAKFVPASLPFGEGEAPPVVPVVSVAPATIRYQVAVIGRSGAIALTGDPMAARDLPMGRLVTNVVATFALILFCGLAVAATVPRMFGYGSVVVTSGSMEPAVRRADVVVTSPSDGEDLGAGVVINFERDGEGVLHRIKESTPDGYRTAGDANQTPDSELVSPSQVRGVGIVLVPFVGLPATWVAQGQWPALALAFSALVACLYMSRGRWIEPDQELALR